MADDFVNLEDTIADAVNDAQLTDDTPALDDSSSDVTPEADVSAEPAPEATETPVEETSTEQVPSPAAGEETAPQDEFERLAGMPAQGFGGRENRIPYSRVKKITEKAVEKAVTDAAEAVLGRKLNPGEKAVDVVKAHVAQIPELTSKVTDYETRLNSVGEFENVMANDPQRFLTMLSKVPAYQEFFQFINYAYDHFNKQGGAAASPEQATAGLGTPQAAAPAATAGMPEPDEELADGSKVYSIQGLQRVLDWRAQQIEAKISKQFEDKYKSLQERYEPIANDWQTQRRLEAAKPFVEKKLAEAQKWPLFNENEEEITKVLMKDKNISLEAAYRTVVFPKLLAERSQIKQGVIKEMQAAPTSTSIPVRAATKPVAPNAGPRTLVDVIKEQVEKIK